MATKNPRMVLAVVEADREKVSRANGITPGGNWHLVSADATLAAVVQRELVKTPHSELAMHVANLLQNERLFEMVGHWPPDRTSTGGPRGTSTLAPGICSTCGAPTV